MGVKHMTNNFNLKFINRKLIVTCAEARFIGSQANFAILVLTSIFLFAGRSGLAPSANKPVTAGLKLRNRESGLKTRDPAGFTVVDTLAFGAMGHIVGGTRALSGHII